MLGKLSIAWIYALIAVFIAGNLILLSRAHYELLLLPVVIAVIALLFYNPKSLIYIIALATPLSVQLGRDSQLAISLPTEPLILLLFLAFGLKWLLDGKLDRTVWTNGLVLLLSVELLWMLITGLTGSMPMISLKYVLSRAIYFGVAFLLLIPMFKDPLEIKRFFWLFGIGVCILALYTLYQHSLGGFGREYAYTAMRPFLPDHGMYAAMISFAVPVFFVFAIHGDRLGIHPIFRILAFGLFAFLALAVALSFTRASWLSLVIAFGVYFSLRFGVKFRYLVLIAVLAIGYLASNLTDIQTELSRNKSESDDNIEEHLQSVSNVSTDPSNLERLNRWSSAIRMFEDRPILGFGPGTYTFEYGVYQLPHQMTIISTNAGDQGNVHSEYLRPLVEGGVLAFLLFLGIVLVCIYWGYRQYSRLEGPMRYLSLAAYLALITYLAHGLLNNYSEFDKIAIPMFACMAILTAQQIQLSLKDEKQALEE